MNKIYYSEVGALNFPVANTRIDFQRVGNSYRYCTGDEEIQKELESSNSYGKSFRLIDDSQYKVYESTKDEKAVEKDPDDELREAIQKSNKFIKRTKRK